ncbi:hypothetical protein R1sor_003589 [Riccia sorocarpa]|uniref:HNH homing endonuclease n=1 Tax=Riccia sorocarpa TaxID=122646 RepID=A0ABD3H4Y8_9MARC
MKPWIQYGTLLSREDWRRIPIWGSAQGARDGKIRKCNTQARKLLWEAGYMQLGDLTTDRDDTLAEWEDRKLKGVDTQNVRKAFEKLVAQVISIEETQLKEDDVVEGWFEDPNEVGTVWKWQTKGGQKYDSQPVPEEVDRITQYRVQENDLVPCPEVSTPTTGVRMTPTTVITYRVGKGKAVAAKGENFPAEAKELMTLTWKNGSNFFEATNSQLRRMISRKPEAVADKIKKWEATLDGVSDSKIRWRAIWRTGSSNMAESYFFKANFLRASQDVIEGWTPNGNHILLISRQPAGQTQTLHNMVRGGERSYMLGNMARQKREHLLKRAMTRTEN